MFKKIVEKGKVLNKSLFPTGLIIVVIIVSLLVAYFMIVDVLRERSIGRMEEGVNTVISEVTAKFKRDSEMLNATADMLSNLDTFDTKSALAVMSANSSLFELMQIKILMPNETILSSDGTITDANISEDISFAEESKLGEHVSNRVMMIGSEKPVLRHFVPIKRNGKVAAVLYGLTDLENLEPTLNIDNIYNASAEVYIFESKTGNFILDTYHDGLGNIDNFSGADYTIETKDDPAWEEYTDSMKRLEKGYVIFRTPRTDGWQYMYYAPAEMNEWVISVQVPESEVFASVFAVQKIWFVVGIILLVAMIIYYIWVTSNYRQYTKQAVQQAVLTEKLKKAEAADKAKSMFLSNMSHDIRTPMNAIIGYTTLVQANLDNREKTEEYLKKILSSSNHMLSLINDILDMSRIESGKLNIEEKECSISDIFRDMRNIIQTQMKSKQLNFYMDTIDVIDEDIYCDKLHTNQVILNLLSNAIKFTPAGGSVGLTIRQKPNAPSGFGAYEIRVKDNGIGMSEEFTKHIFEPFERATAGGASV